MYLKCIFRQIFYLNISALDLYLPKLVNDLSMLKENLKMTQTIEIISHIIPKQEKVEKLLQKIQEDRFSNPRLWDQIVKLFQKK